MKLRRNSRLSAVFSPRASLAALTLLLLAANPARAQVSITTFDSPVTENFDGMGSSATATLPPGFKIFNLAAGQGQNDWNEGVTATTVAAGSTGTTPTAGGSYNWASGATASSTDRAVGYLTSSNANWSGTRSIAYAFTNNTGAEITGLDIAFDYEKYRTGTRAFGWTFFHGGDSAPASAAITGDHAYPGDANNTTLIDPPALVSKAVALTDLSIADGETYYLRWTLTGDGGTSNAQGLGIDNFSITARGAPAGPADLIFSEYVEGSSNNKAVEIFNGTGAAVDLADYKIRIEGFTNAGGPLTPATLTFTAPTTLADGEVYVVCNNSASATLSAFCDLKTTNGALFFTGDDSLTLLHTIEGVDTIIDIIGQVGVDPGDAWGTPPTSTQNNTIRRKPSVCAGDTNGADAFDPSIEWDGFANDTFDGLGEHSVACSSEPEPTLPIVSFSAGAVSALEGNDTGNTLTFAVEFTEIAENETLSFDIAVTGPAGRFDAAGVPASVTLDDQSVSPYIIEVATVPNTDTDGDAIVVVTLSNFDGADASQSSPLQKQGTIVDDDLAHIKINQVQGSGQISPYDGQVITTRGIVTAITQSGPRFYIQSAADDEDSDPATSEGLYVYGIPSPAVSLAVGDFVYVTGRVSDYTPATATQLPITELVAPVSVIKLTSGNALPEPVVLTAEEVGAESDIGYLERYEFMRVTVPSFVATAPSGAGTNDEFFGTVEGIARPFREPGVNKFRCGVDPALPGSRALPAEAPANVPCWDNNPELLRVKTNVIAGSSTLPVRTGTKFENLTGILDYAFERYTILTTSTPAADATNAENGTAVTVPGAGDITVGAFNVEWLGCPTVAQDPVNGSNSCNPRGGTVYNRKVAKIGQVIVDYLHSPDVIGIIEGYDTLVLGDIAQKVAELAGVNDPQYVAVQASTTTGAQRLGFLVKTSLIGGVPRVTLDGPATEYGAGMLVQCPDGSYTEAPAPGDRPGLLNDRPPQVIDVTIRGANGQDFPLTVINTHLKAMGDHENTGPAGGAYTCFNFAADGTTPVADGDGIRNRAKRQQNAEFTAGLVQDLQEANPDQPIVLIGDLNAFEFNDGYADLTNTIAGTPPNDDETVVEGDGIDLVNPDLVVLAQVSDTPLYSYTFQGNAQAIDQVLVNEMVLLNVIGMPRLEYARVNADFHQGDVTGTGNAFGSSDHDPSLAFLDIAAFRTADLSLSTTPAASEVQVGSELTYAFELSNAGPDEAALVRVELSLPSGVLFLALDAPAGWTCNTPGIGSQGSIVCTIDVLAADTDSTFSITAVAGVASSGTTAVATLSVSSGSIDPSPVANATYTTVITALPDEIFQDGFED